MCTKCSESIIQITLVSEQNAEFPVFQLTYCYTMLAQFNVNDYNMKVHIKEQFRQFVIPETTSMCPLKKGQYKGRTKKDKQRV